MAQAARRSTSMTDSTRSDPAQRRSRSDESGPRSRPFLTAQWRHLAIVNFRVDPAQLAPLVPRGTELDLFHGEAYVSLVGFQFLDTRLAGWSIPGHRNFSELNLRYYLRREVGSELRRGVAFIKELVPLWAVAQVARWWYAENYATHSMRSEIESSPDGPAQVRYQWKVAGRWNQLRLATTALPALPKVGSQDEFIVEHYWGYSRGRGARPLEYRVEHPRWLVRPVADASAIQLECDSRRLYGEALGEALEAAPVSALIAEGSPVTVYAPR